MTPIIRVRVSVGPFSKGGAKPFKGTVGSLSPCGEMDIAKSGDCDATDKQKSKVTFGSTSFFLMQLKKLTWLSARAVMGVHLRCTAFMRRGFDPHLNHFICFFIYTFEDLKWDD